jgi:hypothetical protein
MGTALLFAALSLDNDNFAERINLFVALAPVTSLNNMPWHYKLLFKLYHPIIK